MQLTEEQFQIVEKLASLNYTVKQIAMYLDVNATQLQHQFADNESKFRYHYERGKLITQAKIDMQLNDAAMKGNMTAIQQYEKVKNAREFENLKQQMLNGDI